MRLRSSLAFAFLALGASAMAQVAVDGVKGPEWNGVAAYHISHSDVAPESNFSAVVPVNKGASYDAYFRADANYVYGLVTATGDFDALDPHLLERLPERRWVPIDVGIEPRLRGHQRRRLHPVNRREGHAGGVGLHLRAPGRPGRREARRRVRHQLELPDHRPARHGLRQDPRSAIGSPSGPRSRSDTPRPATTRPTRTGWLRTRPPTGSATSRSRRCPSPPPSCPSASARSPSCGVADAPERPFEPREPGSRLPILPATAIRPTASKGVLGIPRG